MSRPLRFVPVLAFAVTLLLAGCGTQVPSTSLRSVLQRTPEARAFLDLADALDVDILDAVHLTDAASITLFVPDQAMLDAYADFVLGGRLEQEGEHTMDDLLAFAQTGEGADYLEYLARTVVAHAFADEVTTEELIEIVDDQWVVYDDTYSDVNDSGVVKYADDADFALLLAGLSLTAYPVLIVEGDIPFDGGLLHVVTVDGTSSVNDY